MSRTEQPVTPTDCCPAAGCNTSAEGVLSETIPAFQRFLTGLTIDMAEKRPKIGLSAAL